MLKAFDLKEEKNQREWCRKHETTGILMISVKILVVTKYGFFLVIGIRFRPWFEALKLLQEKQK